MHVHANLTLVMAHLKNKRWAELLIQCGIPQAEGRLLTQAGMWMPQDRRPVRAALDAILFGTLDMQGLPRFAVSAEYVAGWIALTVDPVNWMPACQWYDGAHLLEDLASEEDITLQSAQMNAAQLCALVQAAVSSYEGDDMWEYRQRLIQSIAAPVAKRTPAAKKQKP